MKEIKENSEPLPRLGALEERVLWSVFHLGGQGYGVTLRQEVEARTGQHVALNAIYLTLERLEKKGFVRSWLGDPTPERGGRAKRFYAIEGAGELALSRAEQISRQMRVGLQHGLSSSGG